MLTPSRPDQQASCLGALDRPAKKHEHQADQINDPQISENSTTLQRNMNTV